MPKPMPTFKDLRYQQNKKMRAEQWSSVLGPRWVWMAGEAAAEGDWGAGGGGTSELHLYPSPSVSVQRNANPTISNTLGVKQ